jgi:hypothetical protein
VLGDPLRLDGIQQRNPRSSVRRTLRLMATLSVHPLELRRALCGEPSRARRGSVLVGALAGLIGLACSVTPAVLALLGLSTVSFAIALGNTLYYDYGWYFRGAGLSFAVAGVIALLRARKSCSIRGARREWRLLVMTALTMVVVYGALYWLTTWLASLASPSWTVVCRTIARGAQRSRAHHGRHRRARRSAGA